MSERIVIKFHLPFVLPLLDIIRAQAATFEDASRYKSVQAPASVTEVRNLLAMFRPNFSTSGEVVVDESQRLPIVRACSVLRLQLRHSFLAALSDTTLESGLDEVYTGEERNAVMCYLFLATIQDMLLQHLPFRDPRWYRLLRDFPVLQFLLYGRRWIPRNAESLTASAAPVPSESWQVVVLNDPVNLMSYVTEVLCRVLALTEEIAEQRMREVHELKRSAVWVGPRKDAEVYARALRAWHLQVVVQTVLV